jgi:hypothetical protein
MEKGKIMKQPDTGFDVPLKIAPTTPPQQSPKPVAAKARPPRVERLPAPVESDEPKPPEAEEALPKTVAEAIKACHAADAVLRQNLSRAEQRKALDRRERLGKHLQQIQQGPQAPNPDVVNLAQGQVRVQYAKTALTLARNQIRLATKP